MAEQRRNTRAPRSTAKANRLTNMVIYSLRRLILRKLYWEL